jgi:hypothetical protein
MRGCEGGSLITGRVLREITWKDQCAACQHLLLPGKNPGDQRRQPFAISILSDIDCNIELHRASLGSKTGPCYYRQA